MYSLSIRPFRPLLRICLWLGLLMAPAVRAQELVPAYNSYLQPPFSGSAGDGGLAHALVEYLNRRLAGHYVLKLESLPRSRLLKLLGGEGERSFKGVALFLNPAFLGDAQRQSVLWTQSIAQDRNVLIFGLDHRPVPTSLDQLRGLRFGGILGNRYGQIDEMAALGQLTREDVRDEMSNLRKLVRGRIDFTQTNQSYYRAMALQAGPAQQLLAVPRPDEDAFSRHIAVGRQHAQLYERIERIVAEMPQDAAWRIILRRYGQEPLTVSSQRSR